MGHDISGIRPFPQAHRILELTQQMARVVLENVRVDFPIYATQRNLRTAIFNRATGGFIQRQGKKQGRVVVEALAGVTMTFEDGDRVGLIGHNGSGKSTLLKVLAGIYEPIEGRLLVEGRVMPLFDMMPGLDPEDSGYENIITCGLLLGLSRDEIESKIPNVEEFCELGEYLALPVRTYSTGMTMRLGFALVTSLDPGVLLMDEGIGAGDARFAERAERRLNEFIGRSQILVLASHSHAMIKSMCNKAALLQAGRLVAFGPVDEVFERYIMIVHRPKPSAAAKTFPTADAPADAHDEVAGSSGGSNSVAAAGSESDEAPLGPAAETWHCASFTADPKARHEWGGYGNEWAECIGGTVETLDGEICERPEINLPFRVCLRYRLLKDSRHHMVPNFHFDDALGQKIMVVYPSESSPTIRDEYQVCCVIEPFSLNTGRYLVGLALTSYEPETLVHFSAPFALRFEVVERPGVDPRRHGWAHELPGVTRLRLDWQYTPMSLIPANPLVADRGQRAVPSEARNPATVPK
jgi:ABC-type polysaccharide/polyol phosphate transport system ATPase subunit